MTHDHPIEAHDLGLGHDLAVLRAQHRRRAVLGLLGGGAVGGALLAGGALGARAGATGTAGGSAAAAACRDEIPAETAGPFPGDGSNGPDVLDDAGVVRRDLRSSFGESAGGTADGVVLDVVLKLRDTSSCTAAAGLAVYAWHCDREGRYSMYSDGVEDENYLRGVQVSNEKGRLRFRTIYPACYPGRWPHVHFEVYRSRAAATGDGAPLATSQLALPRRTSMHVYENADGYQASVGHLNRISLGSDGVFGDDRAAHQMATVTGSIARGYRATLVVPVDV